MLFELVWFDFVKAELMIFVVYLISAPPAANLVPAANSLPTDMLFDPIKGINLLMESGVKKSLVLEPGQVKFQAGQAYIFPPCPADK